MARVSSCCMCVSMLPQGLGLMSRGVLPFFLLSPHLDSRDVLRGTKFPTSERVAGARLYVRHVWQVVCVAVRDRTKSEKDIMSAAESLLDQYLKRAAEEANTQL